MTDLYVIEGDDGAGKSTLICHLAGVGRADRGNDGGSVRRLSRQNGRVMTTLVFYSSPNERRGRDPQWLMNRIALEMRKNTIDAIVLPLRPRHNGCSADQYVQVLANGGAVAFQGYARLGQTQFYITNSPQPITFPTSPANPPSNVIAEAVRTNWGWR